MSIPSRRAFLSVLVLGLGWGLSPAGAQTYRPGSSDPYSGRGYTAPYPAASDYGDRSYSRGYRTAPSIPGHDHGDPYPAASDYGDRSYSRGYNTAPYTPNPGYADPYSGRGYGEPYAPRGYEQPYSPPAQSPYGGSYRPPGPDPREYRRDAYRPVYPEPHPGDFGGYVPTPQPPAYGGSAQVVALADVLVNQVDAFIQVFSQTARVVPQGGRQLADAQALSAAAHSFRQVAASGVAPAQLSIQFRAVEGIYNQISGRTAQIAQGRTGPNIQQIALIGQTIQQIRLACP